MSDAFTTTQVAAALKGIMLQRIGPIDGSGGFIVSRRNMSRTVTSLDEARRLFTRMTGSRP